jgi:hypothetical protein
LYQVNFTVPARGLRSGDVYVNLQTDEAVTEISTIALTGFPRAAVAAERARRPRIQKN